MAEPKGGPVKPPILDLKPVKSTTSSKTASSATSKSARPDPKNPKTSPSNAAEPKTHPNRGNTHQSSKSQIAAKGLSPTYTAILGAVGGAALALLLIIPMFLSGFLQPASQRDTQTQIETRLNAFEDRLFINQERTDQSMLLAFDAFDKQINDLRLNLDQQTNLTGAKIEQLSSAQQDIAAQTSALSEQDNNLQTQIGAIQLATASLAPTFDANAIEQNIHNLNTRLDAIAAGASTEDAEKLTTELELIQTQLANLTTTLQNQSEESQTTRTVMTARLDAQDQRLTLMTRLANARLLIINQQSSALEELRTTSRTLTQAATLAAEQMTQATTQNANQEANQSPSNQNVDFASPQRQQMQSALIGLELALTNGRSFENELQSLASQLPDLTISDAILASAQAALLKPNQIIQQFNLAIPDMLAARPPEPNAGWAAQISNSVKSALAIRPTGLSNGDQIENLLNQALAAVNHSDFASANSLLNQLPDSMTAVIEDLALQIQQFGESQKLLAHIQDLLSQNSLPTPALAPINNSGEAS